MVVVVRVDLTLKRQNVELFQYAECAERRGASQCRGVQLRAKRLLYTVAGGLSVVALAILDGDRVESIRMND